MAVPLTLMLRGASAMDTYHQRIPYTYLVGWSYLDMWYYGVRYAKNCHPSDLWTRYFTSSKLVASLRRKYGEPDIIKVRKTFCDPKDAIIWEQKVLRRLNVTKSCKWLNQSLGGTDPVIGTSRYGVLNSMYGKTPWNKGLSKDTSAILELVGRKVSDTKSKQDLSGDKNHFFGKKHTDTTKLKMSRPRKNKEQLGKHKRTQSQKDFNRSQMVELHKKKKPCENCGRIFDLGNYTKHIRKCTSVIAEKVGS